MGPQVPGAVALGPTGEAPGASLPPPTPPGHLLNLRYLQPKAIFTGVGAVGWVLPKAQTHRQAHRLAKCVFLSLFILNGPGPMHLGFF